MCRRPDIQKKVISEIDKFIKSNGRLPSFQERSHLPYCISVMKESMRFRSTVSLGLAHTTYEDCKYSIVVLLKRINNFKISDYRRLYDTKELCSNFKYGEHAYETRYLSQSRKIRT